MKLYYSPGACSMACHIVLNELELPYLLEKVDLKTHKTDRGEDFHKINPKGYVPALQLDDGGILTENAAILTYLIGLKPALVPPVSTDKMLPYRRFEWIVFIATEIHKTLGALWDPNLPPEAVKLIKEKASKRFDFVDKHLAKQSFLLGNIFDAAPDSYLFTVLNWCEPLQVDLSPWDNLRDFMSLIRNRPLVQKTLTEEGLIEAQELPAGST